MTFQDERRRLPVVRSDCVVTEDGQTYMRFPVVGGVDLPKTVAHCRGPGLCPKLGCRMNTLTEVTESGTWLIAGGVRSAAGGYSIPRKRWAKRQVRAEDEEAAAKAAVAAADKQAATCTYDFVERPELMATRSEDREDNVHMTMEEIGVVLHIRRQRADAIYKRAMRKMARRMNLTAEQTEHCLRVLATVSRLPGWKSTPSTVAPVPMTSGVMVRRRAK